MIKQNKLNAQKQCHKQGSGLRAQGKEVEVKVEGVI
jgi:hypothetical protein